MNTDTDAITITATATATEPSPDNLLTLKGRRIVVTGAVQGAGLATVQLALKNISVNGGYHIVS